MSSPFTIQIKAEVDRDDELLNGHNVTPVGALNLADFGNEVCVTTFISLQTDQRLA